MPINNEFLRSISIEENPFENEQPDETRFFDLSGNEVIPDDSTQ